MTDDQKSHPRHDRNDAGDTPRPDDGGLHLAARMQRATAHIGGRGVRADTIPGRSERLRVGTRRRHVAAAAVVALVAGAAVAVASRGGDEPQEVVTAAPTSVLESIPDEPGDEVDGEVAGTDEQPTRLVESGPTIPLGPCSETYPVPAESIGLEARVLIYGQGQMLVELHNTTDEDMVVTNGGRYVALGDDGNIRTDLDPNHNQGYSSEDEGPPASVSVPAGGTGEIRAPIMLVQATSSCPDMPSLWDDVENRQEFEFVYLLGVEGSDVLYASEPDVLTINGDGSATCTEPMTFDQITGTGDCPRPADWSPGS